MYRRLTKDSSRPSPTQTSTIAFDLTSLETFELLSIVYSRAFFCVDLMLAMRLIIGAIAVLSITSGSVIASEPATAMPQQVSIAGNELLDFNRDVRPILSDRCYACHGQDANSRATDLRLDESTSAYELAIVPGKPEDSELVARITSDDDDIRMPPTESNLKLSSKEIEVLRRWIAEGGKYEGHWSLQPLKPIDPPKLEDSNWAKSEIDLFVLEKLNKHHLKPSSIADRVTLIRRLTLDLIGLPPTLAEIEAFCADERPDAYEQLVERLLADPRYGEHMAVPWLDAARYADTYGYQNDRYRPMWPWRDWVVKAFNENLPFDQFITWQIAGDLLPDATDEQILATAFNRNHRQTNEGGSIDEEFRIEYVADRVNTFGTAFLGMTLECCRCHDHKYDPISQKEYYQLGAFFNNIDESGVYSHFNESTPTPALPLLKPDEKDNLAELCQRVLDAEETDRSSRDAFLARFAETNTSSSTFEFNQSLRDQLEQSLDSCLVGDYPFEEFVENRPFNRKSQQPDGKTSDEPRIAPGKISNALLMNGENAVAVSAGGELTRDDPFSITFWLKIPKAYERAVVLHRSKAALDSGSRGYEVLIEEGRLSVGLIHFWPGNAIRIKTSAPVVVNEWFHVTVGYDGSSRAAGLTVFIDGNPSETLVIRDALTKNIHNSDGFPGGSTNKLWIGQRFRDVGLKDGQLDELKVFSRVLNPLEIRYLYTKESTGMDPLPNSFQVTGPEFAAYQVHVESATLARAADLLKLRNERSAFQDQIAEIMVMKEQPTMRKTHLLMRGAWDSPGEEVERAVPVRLFPSIINSDSNRLDLANWLTNPNHPLTSRVAVNRVWQQLFGKGIVSTAEDFGLQGASPSHPELLNWLSYDFIHSGWNVKRLVKQIVMSSVYQQKSDPSRESLELDPENLLLSHAPAIRLSAEQLRDAALAASELLVQKFGGPAVKPYQPPGLWEDKAGISYDRDKGEGSHRRSLYTFWKRTSPPPNMMTFDASNREVCMVKRQATMTPLQVLVLLNDPQFVEAARALAQKTYKQESDHNQRLVRMFRSLCSRSPNDQELVVLQNMYTEQLELFNLNEDDAIQLLSIGDEPIDPTMPNQEIAAYTIVASGLMSFDEFVMRR